MPYFAFNAIASDILVYYPKLFAIHTSAIHNGVMLNDEDVCTITFKVKAQATR